MSSSDDQGYGDFGAPTFNPAASVGGDTFSFLNPYSSIFGGGGNKDADKGYNRAMGFMQPYINGGLDDYNQMRSYTQNQGQMLGKYGNPADWQWQHANMAPDQFYNQMMQGYQQSPQAKYAMNAMQNQVDHAASASGMLGSGAYGRTLNQNANQISQNDQQQYWNNVMGAMGQQSNAINDFQRQQRDYEGNMRWGADMGFDAAGKMGDYAVGKGNSDSAASAKDQSNNMQELGMLAGIAAMFL